MLFPKSASTTVASRLKILLGCKLNFQHNPPEQRTSIMGAETSTGATKDFAPDSNRRTDSLPGRPDVVLRNGYVVSMDQTIGKLPRGDVHMRDGEIVAVGSSLAAAGAETIDASGMIVMPGFIETHWHLWNSLHKNLLRQGLEYFPLKSQLGKHYTALDSYHSNKLALLEAVNAGITTVHNFAHNLRTPEYADAELTAFAESGLRGRFSYGWIDEMPTTEIMPATDAARVQRHWIGASCKTEDRVALGMCLRGPMYCKADVYTAEFKAAKDLNLPVSLHSGQTLAKTLSAVQLRRDGFLDANTLMIHFLRANERDREALREAGASLSLSMQSELRNQADGDVRDQLMQMLATDINVTLSIDSTALGSVSMFDSMSLAWYMGIPWNNTVTAKFPMINFHQCLKMATINGAKALGFAGKTGSLTPGKRADIIAIRATDLNMIPLGEVECALVRSATVANVDTVIADGRVLKRGGRLVGHDVEKIKADATTALFNICKRAGGDWANRFSR